MTVGHTILDLAVLTMYLAAGENVNVMVFDTEMYSNTGGQASKASNIGEVCQFAAAGKDIGKKSLAEIAMSYGYVYVAQIALGANPAQAVKVIAEAEAYNGPSLIIGYAPCELHGIVKGGMNHCQDEMKAGSGRQVTGICSHSIQHLRQKERIHLLLLQNQVMEHIRTSLIMRLVILVYSVHSRKEQRNYSLHLRKLHRKDMNIY